MHVLLWICRRMGIVNKNRIFSGYWSCFVVRSLLTERRAIKNIIVNFLFVVQSHQKL